MCPRTFPSVEELGRHIPMHTFDKLYRCQQCFYRTDSRSNLLRHLRTHTGEKRHGCPVCPYRAGQRSDLRRHLRVHALKQFNNIFRCRLCDETSTSASAFARHILESHSQGENHDEDPQEIPQDPLEDPRTLPTSATDTTGQDLASNNSPQDTAATGELEDPTEDPLDDS
ncbi:zinc finger protein 513-like [Scylla paramamosain]